MLLRDKFPPRRIPGKRLRFPGIAIFLFSILLPYTTKAQWERMQTFPGPICSVFFMDQVGRPDIGFVSAQLNGPGNYFWRTSDGGKSWQALDLPPKELFLRYGAWDFTFKDSLNGWMANYINFRTTDAGLSWIPLSPNIHGPSETNGAIFYQTNTKLLFSSVGLGSSLYGGGGGTRASADEGITWKQIGIGLGFAFSGLKGITTTEEGAPPSLYTTDGGISWSESNFHDECFQPTCIPGTSTFFAASEHANRVSRSDDGGKTWRSIFQFSSPAIAQSDSSLAGCIRIDRCGNLYVSAFNGFLVSSDEGVSWHSIGGPPGWNDVRFWITSDYLYAAEQRNPKVFSVYPSTLWRYRLSNPALALSDGTKRTLINAGSDVTLNFAPTMNSISGADSVHLVIRYDRSLELTDLLITGNWSLLDSSTSGNVLDLWLKVDSSMPLLNPILQLTFKTFLASTSAKVYLDSAHFYGECLQCNCALSLAGPDSVEIDFTGCGETTLLRYMSGESPFEIVSVQPNPASDLLRIKLAIAGDASAALTICDVLCRTWLSVPLAGGESSINVSSLPAGTYYLRITLGTGEVRTKKLVKE